MLTEGTASAKALGCVSRLGVFLKTIKEDQRWRGDTWGEGMTESEKPRMGTAAEIRALDFTPNEIQRLGGFTVENELVLFKEPCLL